MDGQTPNNRCQYTFPEDYEIGNQLLSQNCCWREAVDGEDTDKCIWHAETDEVDKTSTELREASVPPEIRNQTSPFGEILDGISLSSVTLFDKVSFKNVAIRQANLSEVNLRGADLSDADLWDTNMSDAHLWRADLSGANLRFSDLSAAHLLAADLSETDLRGADISEAKLGRANLQGANLRGADLSEADLPGANLSEANLEEADLSGVNLLEADLPEADLRAADLSGANLKKADLSGVKLEEADLSGAKLPAASLSGADLEEANLSGAALWNADLSGASFQTANISGAALWGADLSGAALWGADLSGTHLEGCDLTDSTLRGAILDKMAVDGSTTCEIQDEGYDKKRHVQHPIFSFVIRTLPRWWPGLGDSDLNAREWDATARAYHDLKTTFNRQGLVAKARQQHLRERGARRCEARIAAADDGSIDEWLRWFRSVLVWQLTGYGVSVRRIVRNMGIVFGVSTLAYLLVEFHLSGQALTEEYATVPEILYYSTVTFTTTPPVMPSSDIMKSIVMAETFLGTLLIVFLGYVLGTREQF